MPVTYLNLFVILTNTNCTKFVKLVRLSHTKCIHRMKVGGFPVTKIKVEFYFVKFQRSFLPIVSRV